MIQFPEPAAWEYFRARHIFTGISGATCVKSGDSGQSARALLARGSFDQAPVRSASDRVVGWVAAGQLRDGIAVRRVMTSVADSAIVSGESPIGKVIGLLGQQGLVFTIGDDGVSGFIVHSDLDRQQARTYFYLLVAGIEMLLSDIIRSVYPEIAVVDAMRAGQKKQYDKAKEKNRDAHPVEYLYLGTLVELFIEVPSVKNGLPLNEELIGWLSNLNQFRILVMHPVCSIAASRSPEEIADFTKRAHEVIQRLQVMSDGLHGFGGSGSPPQPDHLG